MQKRLKQAAQGAAVMLAMVMTVLLIMTFKFMLYEADTWNLILQRIGG